MFSAPVADGAVERLLPAVRSAVGGQVGGLRKRLVAAVAPVGALAAVGPQVGLQGAGASVPEGKKVLDYLPPFRHWSCDIPPHVFPQMVQMFFVLSVLESGLLGWLWCGGRARWWWWW